MVGCVIALIVGFLGGRTTEKQRHEALGKGAEELLEKSRIEAEAGRDRRLLEAEREASEIRKKAEELIEEKEKSLLAKSEELERERRELQAREEFLEGVIHERKEELTQVKIVRKTRLD